MSRKTDRNESEISESNDEMKAVIIVASIFVILFIIAICLMTIVIVIKHKSNQIYTQIIF
jgi:lipopolysaccharide/colanic/teichoic acid biosynthesis glycosyltransferase